MHKNDKRKNRGGKLALRTETIRRLADAEFAQAVGGGIGPLSFTIACVTANCMTLGQFCSPTNNCMTLGQFCPSHDCTLTFG